MRRALPFARSLLRDLFVFFVAILRPRETSPGKRTTMTDNNLNRLRSDFDALAQTSPDDGLEFWYARDLLKALGCAAHPPFMTAIRRAIAACEAAGNDGTPHFRGVLKKSPDSRGDQRVSQDFRLSRYAGLLLATTLDSRRAPIVSAREYFAETKPAKADAEQGNKHAAKLPATSTAETVVAAPETPAPSRAPDAPVALNPWQAALQRKQGNAGPSGRFIPGHGQEQLNPGANPRLNKNLAYGRGYPNGAARTSK